MEDTVNTILGPSAQFKFQGIDNKRIETISLSASKLLKLSEKFSELFVPIAFSNHKMDQSKKETWIGTVTDAIDY
jgi:hypothetical protein